MFCPVGYSKNRNNYTANYNLNYSFCPPLPFSWKRETHCQLWLSFYSMIRCSLCSDRRHLIKICFQKWNQDKEFHRFQQVKHSHLQRHKYAPTYTHRYAHMRTHTLTKHKNTFISTIKIKPFPQLKEKAVSNEIVSVWHMCLCVFS